MWPGTNIQTKKCTYSGMRSSKLILNSKNPSSESLDDGKTKIFISGLNRISRKSDVY